METAKLNKAYFGNHILNIIIGIVGLILFIIGTLMPGTYEQKYYFLYGAILLTISSFLEKNSFFTVLETIIVIDAVISFLGLSAVITSIITFIIIIITIICFAAKGEFKEKYLIAGTIGLIFLGLGVGINNPIFYTIGGFFVALYSLMSIFKGFQIAYLFLILNIIFTITSAIGAYEWLVK
ncbi:MAG TPA: hypothetical protein QF753_14940 [Victivallales bacterium]|nr:hypothetical protein [Victivallales bacterium]